jgi:hypothetical protein
MAIRNTSLWIGTTAKSRFAIVPLSSELEERRRACPRSSVNIRARFEKWKPNLGVSGIASGRINRLRIWAKHFIKIEAPPYENLDDP